MIDPGWRRRAFRWLYLTIVAGAAVLLMVWYYQPMPLSNAPDLSQPPVQDLSIPPYTPSPYLNTGADAAYVGSTVCAGCHPKNHQSYLLTEHSRSFSDVDVNAEPADGTFEHVPSRRSYRVYRKDGQLRHEEVVRNGQGMEITRADWPVRYLVGSGHFTRSYLVEINGFLYESPITWYASKQKWAVSPGYDDAKQPGFSREVPLGCIACHSGNADEQGGAVHRFDFHEKAIGCESCHGPGSLHQQFHQTKKLQPGQHDLTVVNPTRLTRSLQEAICASCHQSGIATIAVRGRSIKDYRPGQPLSDYRIHYRLSGANESMTVVGHVDQLRQSSCYQKSETLTCVTCHDPHSREKIADKTAFYRNVCMTCHANQPCKMEIAERMKKDQDNCAACHMPRGNTEIPHIAFTHHRIDRHQAKSVLPEKKGVPELLATDDNSNLGPLDRQRNLGLAYWELCRTAGYAEYAAAFRGRARENLCAAYEGGIRDGETKAALAELCFNALDRKGSVSWANDALQTPDTSAFSRSMAHGILANCYKSNGNLAEASHAAQQALQLRSSTSNWWLLGQLYLDQNQPNLALPAFQQALTIQPYRPLVFSSLAETYHRLGNPRLSQEYLQKARSLKSLGFE